jgi:hypothetical protein
MTLRTVMGALLAIGISAAAACSDIASQSPTAPSPGPAGSAQKADVRMITGSAEVEQMPGLVYRNTIDGKKHPDGTVSGTLLAQISDLSAFGSNEHFTVVHQIDCLEFSGDSVWFGATITASSRPEAVVGLEKTIGQIKKVNGQDHLFSGPAQFYVPPGTMCTDRPVLPIAPVRQGQFAIR